MVIEGVMMSDDISSRIDESTLIDNDVIQQSDVIPGVLQVYIDGSKVNDVDVNDIIIGGNNIVESMVFVTRSVLTLKRLLTVNFIESILLMVGDVIVHRSDANLKLSKNLSTSGDGIFIILISFV